VNLHLQGYEMMDDEGSAKYLHTDYQALGSDLAGITSKAKNLLDFIGLNNDLACVSAIHG
jgi:hypothetical protein